MLRPPASGRSGLDDPVAGMFSDGVAVGVRAVDVGLGSLVGRGVGVSVGGDAVGVRVGTVWRAGLCPGAAHRPGPATSPSVSIPSTTIQSVSFFIALSPKQLGTSYSCPQFYHVCRKSPVEPSAVLWDQRLRLARRLDYTCIRAAPGAPTVHTRTLPPR